MTIPSTMAAVLLTGHGGFEKLEYREDIPLPVPGEDEVLIKVAAAGINNTDINTRIAWYSKQVTGQTNDLANAGSERVAHDTLGDDGSWTGDPLSFPRIQGADICGCIVAVGDNVSNRRIGERVLVRSMQRIESRPWECRTIGSECDGGFAQFTKAPSRETWAINCNWSDEQLASMPCAWSTAEGLLHRASAGAETILVTGASGGVGSAAVQLAKRRGARVIGIASAAKMKAVEESGADSVIEREENLIDRLGTESVDVVVDLVAGAQWNQLMEVLRRGGRYATAGAIAGPIVELDVRTLYLKDLSFFGCTFQEEVVFENLISYIESGEIRPPLLKTYPLDKIIDAQKDFIAKKYPGKLVLIPPI